MDLDHSVLSSPLEKLNKFQLPLFPLIKFILKVATCRNCVTASSVIYVSSSGLFSHRYPFIKQEFLRNCLLGAMVC